MEAKEEGAASQSPVSGPAIKRVFEIINHWFSSPLLEQRIWQVWSPERIFFTASMSLGRVELKLKLV